MLIPAAIGLIISAIFLSFSPIVQGAFLISNQNDSIKIGRVLGVSEQNNVLNKAIVRVVEEAKTLPRPQLYQLPRLDQPLKQITENSLVQPVGQGEPVMGEYDFPAENGVILECNSDNLFFAKRPDRPWPIASITKLFTAYAFLDYNPGWDTGYEIKLSDKREGGKIYLFTGDKVKVKDLFYFSLVGSDNTATAALVRATGLSEEEFVKKMNVKVKSLGFKNTRLVDPIGLKDGNVSTAREVALFSKIALAEAEISRAVLTKTYKFYTEQGREKSITSTDELLDSFPNKGISLLGGKTGFINSSGYCLVSQFINNDGQAIVAVVLGADSDNSRFDLTKKLVESYYKNNP